MKIRKKNTGTDIILRSVNILENAFVRVVQFRELRSSQNKYWKLESIPECNFNNYNYNQRFSRWHTLHGQYQMFCNLSQAHIRKSK